MESSIATWKYLRYIAGAAQLMTEVVADLEIALKEQGVNIQNRTQPGDPPPMPWGGGMCFPPEKCKVNVAELAEYVGKLRTYVDRVFELGSEHITAARERGVSQFSYRVVGSPEIPKK
jgi:hypothetical protein